MREDFSLDERWTMDDDVTEMIEEIGSNGDFSNANEVVKAALQEYDGGNEESGGKRRYSRGYKSGDSE